MSSITSKSKSTSTMLPSNITIHKTSSYTDIVNAMNALRNTPTENECILEHYVKTLKQSLFDEFQKHGAPIRMHDDRHSVSLTKLSSKHHGRYVINKIKHYWSLFLRPLFFKVVNEGNSINKHMSIITLTPIAKEILFGLGITNSITPRIANQILLQSDLDVYNTFYNEVTLNNDDVIKTPINLKTLTEYIDYTEQQLSQLTSTKQSLKDTLIYCLTHARSIKQMAQGYVDYTFMQLVENHQADTTITDDTWAEVYDSIKPMLVQRSFVSDFGRTYTTGVNLQSAPKEVRIAAIGASYHYDISASVYAWKNDFVRKISDFKPSCTLGYLDTKNQFRKHIATIVFPDWMESDKEYLRELAIKRAKGILTAIGFGATASSPGWVGANGKYTTSAIRTSCPNNDAYKRLIADPEFSSFINEQKQISKILVEYYNRTCTANDNINTPAKKVAYLYQQHEAELMKQVIVLAKQKTPGLEVKLQVHDALYTNMKIDLDTFITVQEQWPSLKFDHDIATPYKLNTLESEHDREEREHREFMSEQERIARQRYGANSYEPPKYTNDYSQCLTQDDVDEVDKQAAAIEMAEFIEQAERNRNPVSALKDPNKTAEESAANRARLDQLMGKK